jgi:hypothetical protein
VADPGLTMLARSADAAPGGSGEAMIARRLRTLGHAPDYLSPGAVDCLLAHAGGSAEQVRVGLAAVLFLAATEDAPLVDEALAARALQTHRAVAAGPAPIGSGRSHWLLPTLFGVMVTGLLLAVAVFAARRSPVAAPEPAMVIAPAPVGSVAITTIVEAAPLTPSARQGIIPLEPPPKVAVPARPAQALAPMPPPITVRQLPVPEAAGRLEVREPPAAASVLLLFPAHSPRALARLRTLALALQRSGIGEIRARPSPLAPTRNAVSFFHDNDAGLAQLVAAAVASAHWPHLDRVSLQPSLVFTPSRGDGEIEVRLP